MLAIYTPFYQSCAKKSIDKVRVNTEAKNSASGTSRAICSPLRTSTIFLIKIFKFFERTRINEYNDCITIRTNLT